MQQTPQRQFCRYARVSGAMPVAAPISMTMQMRACSSSCGPAIGEIVRRGAGRFFRDVDRRG